MLSADGETDGTAGNAHISQFLVGQLRMRGGGRMNNQGLYVSNVGQQGENLKVINEPKSLFLTALDLEGEDRSTAVREILLIQGMVRMLGQGRMADLCYFRMLCQIANDFLSVFYMTLYTEAESFGTLQK